eukprot:scaffold101346_cov68-Cyclotella_meneghiniana.AAC.5
MLSACTAISAESESEMIWGKGSARRLEVLVGTIVLSSESSLWYLYVPTFLPTPSQHCVAWTDLTIS